MWFEDGQMVSFIQERLFKKCTENCFKLSDQDFTEWMSESKEKGLFMEIYRNFWKVWRTFTLEK